VNTLSSTLRSGYPWSALRPASHLRNILISISCVLAFTGCIAADGEGWDVDTAQGYGFSVNGFSVNGFSVNSLSKNGFSVNSLSKAALVKRRLDSDTLVFNQGSAGKLADTEDGRALLQYIARCALVEGEFLRVYSSGHTWDFPGVLGVAPEWEHAPLTKEGQEIMTACLLAHVNAFEVPVQISVRSWFVAEAEELESVAFYYGDGAFYGNLYAGEPAKFSCGIRANRYFDESTQQIETAASPDAKKRICAGEHTAADCDFVFAGYCEEVCNQIERDGNQWRFGDCLGADGQRYPHAFTVWLEGERAESCDVAPVGFTCNPN
jgi:hypothetical protein